MKCYLLLISLSISLCVKSQAVENIEFVNLELYGGEVSSISLLTEGQEQRLYYAENENEVISQNSLSKYGGNVYPIIARVRIYKKLQWFPDNQSFEINFEYLKKINGIEQAFKINNYLEIRHQKILGLDSEDANKYYTDGGNKNSNELLLYYNSQTDVYRLGYIDKSALRKTLIIRNLKATIKSGVKI